MNFCRRAIVLAVLLFAGSWGGAPTFAQQQPVLPSQQHASVQTLSAVAMETLPSVNVAALKAEDRARTDRTGPYRYGKDVDTDLSSSRHGTWEQLPSGKWLWRLRIHSRNAVSLSVGFTRFQLPEGASLYLHGPGETAVRGPYTAADATMGQLWTPLIRGDHAVVELEVPAGRRSATDVQIGKVVYGYRSLLSRGGSFHAKSGTCNLDVACEEADPWRQQVRSVGGYTFGNEDDHLVCSGALVNNTAENGKPLFLTAEHCVSTPEHAASMVFYWNFQTATCREQGTPENGTFPSDTLSVTDWTQTSTGAVLRARSGNWHQSGQIAGKPDLALVEVDDQIPSSYDLYLSGWSRQGLTTEESVTIHHPSGHGKRISFDRDPSTLVDYPSTNTCQAPEGDTHLWIEDWEVGTTEQGSSGAPLFDANQHIVGVLSGGCAGCGGDGDTDDNNAPDWYGRIAPGFESGDYNGTTLADVLDPENSGAETLDGMPRTDQADVTPPAPIQNFRIARVNTREQTVTLEWTATGDDDRTGTAFQYDLRYDTTRIASAADFEEATRVPDPPLPAPAGQSETVVVGSSEELQSDRGYYFAVVAEDDAGNRSPLASSTREAILVKDIEIEKGGVATGLNSPISETRFVLNETQTLRVALYDLLGRRVRVLLDEEVQEGFERVVRFRTGSLASGPYFLRFTGEQFAATRKIVVVN